MMTSTSMVNDIDDDDADAMKQEDEEELKDLSF
jgi:hypothetical protein